MGSRPAAGGGRWVDLAPGRLERWLAGFAERHGDLEVDRREYGLCVAAFDGAIAELHAPPGAGESTDLAGFVAASLAPRRLGLVLARRGAVAVGVAEGDRLVNSKVETHYVQGRTAAGGWSQQRFARRRENQARASAGGAVELVARLLLPVAGELAAVVAGGDRRTVDAILAERRLAPVAALRAERLLDVPEPRRAVLEAAVAAARAVRVRVQDPESSSGDTPEHARGGTPSQRTSPAWARLRAANGRC